MKVKVGDKVLITVGKDKNKANKVVRINKKTNKIVVEKVNIRTKHIKKSQSHPGEKISFEAPFNASNIKIICPHCSKVTRTGYTKLKNNKKQRVCKKCKESLDQLEKTSTSKKAKK